VPFVAKTRMRMHRESAIAFPLPLRERTDRAQRDQVRARESRRLSALTRRAASRHASLCLPYARCLAALNWKVLRWKKSSYAPKCDKGDRPFGYKVANYLNKPLENKLS
jgi:hypothetical protein